MVVHAAVARVDCEFRGSRRPRLAPEVLPPEDGAVPERLAREAGDRGNRMRMKDACAKGHPSGCFEVIGKNIQRKFGWR